MEHYMPKNVLIAEIERRKKELTELSNDFVNQWACASLDNILSFISTLETKEVDIEDAVHGTVDFPLPGYDFPNIYPNYKELKDYCDKNDIKDKDKVKLIIIKEE